MFGSLTVQDNMAAVLARIFRIPVNGKPIAILELGGLPSEIINVVVSVLARLAFDFGVWSAGQIPITFVCEEAHRYVPNDKTLGFEPTKRAISKIAKEGRKYGVSLCIVTQRPAELDPTILSQCNTIFSLRLTNERDQEILKAGISDAAASLLEFMPTMGTGEAVTFGEGVALPTRIKFDMLPPDERRSATPPASPRTGRRTCRTTRSCTRSSTAGARRPTIRTAQPMLPKLLPALPRNRQHHRPATPAAMPTPATAAPQQQSIRRNPAAPGQPATAGAPRPAAGGFGQQVPPQRAAAPAAPPQDAASQQQSLSNLIKQFRT